ncbi:uncharacterized protein DMENIID0001_049410 [Sergentomyia squamirostris]
MERSLICIIVFTVIGFVIFLLGVILGWAVFPPLVRQNIIDNVVLKEGTEQFDRFMELPQPLLFKVYIFNITNSDEVINDGALPIVREVGPYIYRQYRRKHDVVLSNENREITFVQESEYQYDHRLSAPLSQDDPIFILSMHVNSILLEVESMMEIMLQPINEVVDLIFGDNTAIIMRTTPRKFLFDGIEFCQPGRHDLADIVCNIVKEQMPDAMIELPDGSLSFAMFRHKNMTNNGVFRVHTGLEEARDVQQIITWQNSSVMEVWPNNEDNTTSVCNEIHGSDGAAFRPLQEPGETAFIFNTDICRTVQLEYDGEGEYEGIRGFKYAASPYFLDQIGPEYNNSCFCVNQIPGGIVQENGCLYPGAFDLSPCTVTQTHRNKEVVMTSVAHLIVVVLLLGNIEGKVYDRCELALELRHRHEIASDTEVATWVCIAQHQSAFDTAAIGRQADGRGYHGLLQISDEFWCSLHDQGKACAMSCSRFVDDDITDDLHCSRIIHEEHQRISGDGFNAWTVYKTNCNNGRALPHIHGCFDNYISGHDYQTPVVTQPSWMPKKAFRTHLEKARAKIYDRCELAQELVYKHHVPMEEVAMWVCIAKHESNFNTSAVGHLNADGSGDHGLFQISDIYWCSPPGKGWVCGLSCAQLEDDDISDDVKCMRKIYAEHQRLSGDGFNAWAVYKPHCHGRAQKHIEGCFTDDQDNTIQPVPGIQAPVHPPSYTPPPPPAVRRPGKIYDRCELARELLYDHLLPRDQIATWVCIAHHESSFNTAAVGRLNADGSADHGLFQISDLFWCSPPGNGLGCGLSCDLLEDGDIRDDVECIKRIHKEHTKISGNGFTAWTVYQRDCLGYVDHYILGCFPEETIPTTTLQPTTVRTTTTTVRTTTTPRLGTSRRFSFSFGERINPKTQTTIRSSFETTTATPKPSSAYQPIYTTTPKVYTFKPSTTTAVVTPKPSTAYQQIYTTTTPEVYTFKTSTTPKTATTKKAFNIFDFYLNYFKSPRKTTKKPYETTTVNFESFTQPTIDSISYSTPTTTKRPSVFDVYFRRTTTTAQPTSFSFPEVKTSSYFANSLPTVKPFDLDYIKGLTTPTNKISRSAQIFETTNSPQRIHFDSIFDTFFHG